MMNWKNTPSPISIDLTGTKFEPKNNIETKAATKPVAEGIS
jgi:hypothetical protein